MIFVLFHSAEVEKVKYMRFLMPQKNVQKFTIMDYVPKNWKKS